MKSRTPRSRPKLDRETIVEAAIARVERYGLDELSARKLAADLGCEAMSLYHHVGNMEALKDAIVDRLVGSISSGDGLDPIQSLAQESEAFLALAQSYPCSFLLIATRRWKGERAAMIAMRVVVHFRTLGLQEREAMAKARTLGAYLNGAGLALAAWANDAAALESRTVAEDLRSGLSSVLAVLSAT